MQITQKTINSVNKIRIEGFEKQEAKKIQGLHKKLLEISMKHNNSNEVGLLVNLINWEEIVIYGTETGISLGTDSMAREWICTAPKNSLIFLHNHPKNSVFSETDLNSFLTADSIMMMSVICNNGRQYFLLKRSQFDKYEALVYYDKVYDIMEEGSVREFLRTCRKVGLHFIYGGE